MKKQTLLLIVTIFSLAAFLPALQSGVGGGGQSNVGGGGGLPSGFIGITNQIQAPNGTAGAPSYGFSGAAGAGMYLNGNTPVIAQNGSGILTIGVPSTFGFALQLNSTLAIGANACTSASPAACGASAAGAVAVAASSATLVVNTTAVTANSQILLTEDASLGTKLSVTCNTTPTVQPLTVTARTSGTSFTFSNTAPTTNPRCVNYLIVN